MNEGTGAMKRLLWTMALLCLPGLLCIHAVASQIGSREIDVKAKYKVVSNTPASYSVDLQWTDMTFTYIREDTHTWNPKTHTYKTGSKSGWEQNRGTITVTNHSNVDVRVTVEYLPEADTGIKGVLKNAKAKLKAGVVGDYKGADSMTATLTVSGKPIKTMTEDGSKIGKLRITIQ